MVATIVGPFHHQPGQTLTDPNDPHATAELAVNPSFRGQADLEILGQRGRAAARSGSTSAAKTGFSIVDEELTVTEESTTVAHATVDDIEPRTRPDEAAQPVASFTNPTDRGGPLVFLATGQRSGDWLEVQLPVRPNGTTGWVERADVDLTQNPYRITVDTSAHELTIFHRGRVHSTTTVAIGTGATPTPIGDFYLIELLRSTDPDSVYGPYAYGLSGFSETLDSFNGGEGVIGIHGTNQPALIGQDVSHGCIRVANPTIEEMVQFLPLGTPVSILDGADDTAGPKVDGV